jgi:glyoxylase-like metal-dependent hydrolase (beta-lactamase superfamily II)/rhodanese-related sulfurtransferase
VIRVVAIDTPSLGDRGYLATDGGTAVVIDAQRDFDRVLALAAELEVPITHVFETHIHNDYVTGGLALAREAGAEYLVNGADPVSFDRTPVADGDVIEAGGMHIRVIGTPGHTFTHLSYALQDEDSVPAVFTGGSLLNGSTGRTDLLGEQHKVALTMAQYGSAQRLAGVLPDTAQVCPTHGFGSFCSARRTVTGPPSTLGEEKEVNPALTAGETEYVATLLAGLDDYPAYYARMGPANLRGPAAPDLSPPRAAQPDEIRRRIEAGEWVVDLRSRGDFAGGHLDGTLNFGLGDKLATYLGWLIPSEMPLTLLGETADDIAAAQLELVRIGIDRPAAAATGTPEDWAGDTELDSFPVADFAALSRETDRRPLIVLDVRRRSEWEEGHIDGALHIPLHELPARLEEISPGEIWVHCHSGYRAAMAASMLAAEGRDVVIIDDAFSAAREAGLVGAGLASSP